MEQIGSPDSFGQTWPLGHQPWYSDVGIGRRLGWFPFNWLPLPVPIVLGGKILLCIRKGCTTSARGIQGFGYLPVRYYN